MTMGDDKCDVCGVNPPIGVACTSMPMSVAYCHDCAVRHADPELVFVCFFDDFGTRFEEMACPDQLTTYKDGRYMSYREWALEYGVKLPPMEPPPEQVDDGGAQDLFDSGEREASTGE